MGELSHIALIWAGALVAVMVARATRLTPVVYYLGVGAILVNLGWLPRGGGEFTRSVSELGIILIMFALGFEENASDFMKSIKKSWGIAFFGAVAPFTVSYSVAMMSWGSFEIALLCGLAMTATSVSLSMVSLRSEGLRRSPVATRIMTSAVLDSVASMALVAVVIPIATSTDGAVGVSEIAWILVKALLYFLVMTVIGVLIFPADPPGILKNIPLVGRFGLRQLLRLGGHESAILQMLLIALISALLGHALGFHPAVGAYMAGLIINEEYFSPGSASGSHEDTKRILDNLAFSWLGPVFFVTLGTYLVFDADLVVRVAPTAALLTAGVICFQVVSAGLAAHYTGGMKKAASLMIGFGMLGRAELAFVVMDIAYVENQILNEEAFFTLMLACFGLNVAVPLAIHWWRPVYDRELATEVEVSGS